MAYDDSAEAVADEKEPVDSKDEEQSESPESYGSDFESAIKEAFPDNDWDGDRLAAMKEAIRLCVEKDEGGDLGPPPSKAKPGSLAIIFGAKPKKS